MEYEANLQEPSYPDRDSTNKGNNETEDTNALLKVLNTDIHDILNYDIGKGAKECAIKIANQVKTKLNIEISFPEEDLYKSAQYDILTELIELLPSTDNDLSLALKNTGRKLQKILGCSYYTVTLPKRNSIKSLSEFEQHTYDDITKSVQIFHRKNNAVELVSSLYDKGVLIAHNEIELFKYFQDTFDQYTCLGIKSLIRAAIYNESEDNKIIGYLETSYNHQKTFSETEIKLHVILANLINAYNQNRFYKTIGNEIEKKHDLLKYFRKTFNKILHSISENNNTNIIVDQIIQTLVNVYDVSGGIIWTRNGKDRVFSCLGYYDKESPSNNEIKNVVIDCTANKSYMDVIVAHDCISVNDINEDIHLSALFDQYEIHFKNVSSLLDAGIFNKNELIGSILLYSTTQRTWHEEEQFFLVLMANQLSHILKNKN